MKMNLAFAVMFTVVMQFAFCCNSISANDKIENEAETTLACKHCDGKFCDKCN